MEVLSKLKNIPRAGWLQSGVELPLVENVSEHSYDVCVVSMLIADALDGKIDREKLLKAAIVHDWAECLVMDLPRPARKYFEDLKAVKRAERRAMEDLLKGLPRKEEYMKLWEVHLSDEVEGKLLKLADNYVTYLQAKRYKSEGHNVEKILEYSKTEVEKALKEFPKLEEIIKL